MNDEIFADMAEQMRPEEQTRQDLFDAIDAEQTAPSAETAHRRRRVPPVAWLAGAAAVALVAGSVLLPRMIAGGGTVEVSDPPRLPRPAPQRSVATTEVAGEVAGDYAKLYTAVKKAADRWGGGWGGLFSAADGAVNRQSGSLPVPMPAADMSAAAEQSGAYQTNTQVAGIDEGDIVKSDGRTLFIVSDREVVLVDAAGKATSELARIDTTKGPAAPKSDGDTYVVQGPVVDLMLHGSTLVVLVTEYTPRMSELPASTATTYVPFDAAMTKALLYDVSNPGSPKFLTSLGQSGAYLTSRLTGGLLYLVTEYILTDSGSIDPDDPTTFVPLVGDGATRSTVDAADCLILPYPDGPRYAVASSIDLGSRKRIDTESVLGGSQTVYLNNDNLFLAAPDYESMMSATARKAAGVDDLRQVSQTRLARIKLSNGELTLAGQGSVPGTVINQFALDEYEGHLRVAVTVSAETSKGGWTSRPALYVLDSSLDIVGSLPKLAKNESVQSVRFDGPVGYVVSYERIDPLFAIDLKDPAEPTVMSALKIPGFSTYLHPWSDGRLLGLGMDATKDGNITGMKLSMFDTSDPFDVSEQTTIKVTFDDAEALANHKAVLVDTGRGLIGFAAISWNPSGNLTQRYLVYRYAGGDFELAEKLPLQAAPDGYGIGTRGLTLGDHLYVVSSAGVDVYRADSFDKVAGLGLGRR